MPRTVLLGLAAACFALTLLKGDDISDVLAHMDRNASQFRDAKASLKQVSHNAAVDVENSQIGVMYLKRDGTDYRILISFQPPEEKTVWLQGKTADIYYPKLKTVQEYDVGKNRQLFDQYFLLGFGSSGQDVAKSYAITSLGPATVNGETANHLQLIPKTKEVLANLRKVEIWMSDKSGYPVQQKLYQPSGDTITLVYSDLKINTKFSDSLLKPKLPKGVEIKKPQM